MHVRVLPDILPINPAKFVFVLLIDEHIVTAGVNMELHNSKIHESCSEIASSMILQVFGVLHEQVR